MMSSSFSNNLIIEKYQHKINELNNYALILASKDRGSVDVSCINYDILLIGKMILKEDNALALEKVYSSLNDFTGEIKAIWSRI